MAGGRGLSPLPQALPSTRAGSQECASTAGARGFDTGSNAQDSLERGILLLLVMLWQWKVSFSRVLVPRISANAAVEMELCSFYNSDYNIKGEYRNMYLYIKRAEGMK